MIKGILLPKPGLCPECAIKHKTDKPHDLHSLYYQTQFRLKHGRQPTWEDALKHCDETIKKIWREELIKAGETIK